MPSAEPPSARPMSGAVIGPSIQPWKKVPQTRSPVANRVTPSPVAITVPAPSEFGIRGYEMPRGAGSSMVVRSR